MGFVTHAGARLYWTFEGAPTKPVLVLLHSIGTDMAMWNAVAPLLTPGFRLLRLDIRGHGASDAPQGDYSLSLLADDVLAVMDAAGVQQAAICGLSLGGMVAMELALKAPQRVAALVLACTSAGMDPANWKTRLETLKKGGLSAIADVAMERFFAPDFRRTHPDAVESARAILLGMNQDGYAGAGAAIRDIALADRIGAIKIPALVIGGRQDISTPHDGNGSKIAAAIAGSRTVLLNTAHLCAVEAPADFAAAVRGFLGADAARDVAAATLFDAGLATRRVILGDAWVDKSLAARTDFNADYQSMITRVAWNEIWNRPGLDHRTRRLLVLAITASLGRWEEFCLHVRSGLGQGGFTEGDLKEVLMQVAIYAGLPAGNTGFAEAAKVMADMEKTKSQ